jgi:hypothetical protein
MKNMAAVVKTRIRLLNFKIANNKKAAGIKGYAPLVPENSITYKKKAAKNPRITFR